MKKIILFVTGFIALGSACKNSVSNSSMKDTSINQSSASATTAAPLREKVLTAEEQKALTPDMVIQSLKEGNARFMNNNVTARDHSAMVRDASAGQYPKAVILSCLD